MIDDDDISAALQELTRPTAGSEHLLGRIRDERLRRKRTHHAVTVAGAGLAVTGLFAGVSWLHDIQQGDEASGGSTPPAGQPSSAVQHPLPTASSSMSPPPKSSSDGLTPPGAPLRAFAKAGYGSSDAALLARIWQTQDPVLAKEIAGQTILDGRPLPITPGGHSDATPRDYDNELIVRFLNSGFDYTDAEKLAHAWKASDPGAAKVVAGQMIEDGRIDDVKATLTHDAK